MMMMSIVSIVWVISEEIVFERPPKVYKTLFVLDVVDCSDVWLPV